jgi:RNA polymerase sigma factor (sigma-70 family)
MTRTDAEKSDGELLAEFSGFAGSSAVTAQRIDATAARTLDDPALERPKAAAAGREAAFKEIVRRHGAMVHGVCLRILGAPHDAEDAAQAAFLTLAQKARALRSRESVAGWLYHVARHVSLRAREAAALRRKREEEARNMPAPAATTWKDVAPVLDAEMDGLPEKYRMPLILHHLEGRSQEESARMLGVNAGTLSSWLNRGRKLLRDRLARRGVALSVGGLALLMTENAAAGEAPAVLTGSFLHTAALAASGQTAAAGAVSANVAALVKSAGQMLFAAKLKTAALIAAGTAAVCAGAAATTLHMRDSSAPAPAVIPQTKPAVNPWVDTPKAQRERYVAPGGAGSGATTADPMSLPAAVSTAQPGDLFWLDSGRYDGAVDLKANGTTERPIIFRARQGMQAHIAGRVHMYGANNWLWGLEITVPELNDLAVTAEAQGAHVINCVLHQSGGGIAGWNRGPGHVYYGNIIYGVGGDIKPKWSRTNYPLYLQNDFDKNGYKYAVQNLLLDGRPFDGDYNLHAYADDGYVSGLVIRQNAIVNGAFQLGGGPNPQHRHIVADNLIYNASMTRLGFGAPIQMEFRNNYLAGTYINFTDFWGEGERAARWLPNVFTGNEICRPTRAAVMFRTSRDGKEKIDPGDIWDRNVYPEPFEGWMHANGKDLRRLDFAAWRQETAAAGNAFDASSRTSPAPKEAKVFVWANEYEPGRGHVAIVNWAKAESVRVDLSAVVAEGTKFTVHPARNTFGPASVEGTYAGPIDIPMGGKEECGVFLVRSE